MIDSILDKCLDEISAGRATVADCLARYPDLHELEPLLVMALELENASEIKPSTAFRDKTRARLLSLPDPPPADGFKERRKSLLRRTIQAVATTARRLRTLLRVRIQLLAARFERLKVLYGGRLKALRR